MNSLLDAMLSLILLLASRELGRMRQIRRSEADKDIRSDLLDLEDELYGLITWVQEERKIYYNLRKQADPSVQGGSDRVGGTD